MSHLVLLRLPLNCLFLRKAWNQRTIFNGAPPSTRDRSWSSFHTRSYALHRSRSAMTVLFGTYVLGHSKKLVFTASVLPKACLGMREEATGFSEVVESMHYHLFQGLDRTRGQTDRAEGLDIASRFPHLEQRDDGGVPPGLWHFSIVEALVEDGQQFLFRGRTEGLEERRRDLIRICGTSASHLFDGAVQVIHVEVGCRAFVCARGLHPSLCFSEFGESSLLIFA